MTIESFRDLVISIVGLAFLVILILIGIFSVILYLKINRILKSVKSIVTKLEAFTSRASEIARPLLQIAAFIQGVKMAVKAGGKSCKKKERRV